MLGGASPLASRAAINAPMPQGLSGEWTGGRMRRVQYLATLAVLLLAGCAGAVSRPPPAVDGAGVSPARPAGHAESAAAPAPTSPRELERIVFSPPAASGIMVAPVLAEQQGFFREEGLTATFPVMRSNLASTGLVAGEVDYVGIFSLGVRDALAGLPNRVVAATVDKSTRRLMAVHGYDAIEQLRGKRISIGTIGGGPHSSGILAFHAFGIDHNEMTWLAFGGTAESLSAIHQGAAEAGVFSSSEVPRAESIGLRTLVRLDAVAPLPEAGVTTSLQKLQTNPGQVKRTLRAVVRALQYLQTDREGSLPAFMQLMSISRDEAAQAYDLVIEYYSPDGTVEARRLRYTIDEELRLAGMYEDVPFSRVADFGPLYEMLADLGIAPSPDAAR